jgi:hypothetical protein
MCIMERKEEKLSSMLNGSDKISAQKVSSMKAFKQTGTKKTIFCDVSYLSYLVSRFEIVKCLFLAVNISTYQGATCKKKK